MVQITIGIKSHFFRLIFLFLLNLSEMYGVTEVLNPVEYAFQQSEI